MAALEPKCRQEASLRVPSTNRSLAQRLKAVIVRVSRAGSALAVAVPLMLLAAGCGQGASRASCGSDEKFEAGGPAEFVPAGQPSATYRTVRCHQFAVYLPQVRARFTAAKTDHAILKRIGEGPSVRGYTIDYQAVGTGTTTIRISTPKEPMRQLRVTVVP